jgi:hypothetical protein
MQKSALSPALLRKTDSAWLRPVCLRFARSGANKFDADITAGTYAFVSAGMNRLLLKTAKSLLPDLKTASARLSRLR